MAGDDEGERVAADCGADSAGCLRVAEAGGNVGIGGGLAHRDLQQRLPDPDFKIGTNHNDVERLVLLPLFRIEDAPGKLRRRILILDENGCGPALAHVFQGRSFFARIGKSQTGQTLVGGHHQNLAERGRMKAVGN